jgi:hypothetical protein
MALLAHHMGEDSLLNWVLIAGTMIPVAVAAGRARLAAACRKIASVLRRTRT